VRERLVPAHPVTTLLADGGEGTLDAESFNGSGNDMVAGRATSVSLLDRFGSDASWGDPLGCVTQAAEQWLREEWTAQ
jgi:hypothetical protein